MHYTLRQILCTMKQPLDLQRPLVNQLHLDRSGNCQEYQAIVHKELVGEAKNILGHLSILLETILGHDSTKWFTPEHLVTMKAYTYDQDSGEVAQFSDDCSCDGDIDFIDDNLGQDDVNKIQEKHQEALESSVSVQIEGLEALKSVHIPDDSIDAGGSIGSCATGTSNFTQKMNDAAGQSAAGEYQMEDNGETQEETADTINANQSAANDNITNGTGGSPNAKTSVNGNHE